ncbi:TPA: hypothetical protein ACQJLZ_000885 [Citrobacter freundii]|uniref:hypothetical protein n=1 Tax=Citrobacter freundii TaxID=546 RepID=UPI0018296F0C|nr:hypothetical protein [Citrobacter freundii]EFE7737398.1 hypothetical protein [Escherichia coli]EFL9697982.1 hypothetical protein [Escherichia coli]MDN4262894.1 hypothetical protein [Citrobacter freundii]
MHRRLNGVHPRTDAMADWWISGRGFPAQPEDPCCWHGADNVSDTCGQLCPCSGWRQGEMGTQAGPD